MQAVAGSACTQPPLHAPVTNPPPTPAHGAVAISSKCQGSTLRGRPGSWVGHRVLGSWLHSVHPPPISAQTFHQDSQAGAQARAPQSLPSCGRRKRIAFSSITLHIPIS